MRIHVFFVSLLIGILSTSPVIAGSPSEELATCMIDSLTGKERKQLGTWIFFGMSSHPEIKPFSNVTDAARLKNDQTIGALLTRLLTEDCPGYLKRAAKERNSLALQRAFELMGQVAMQELMTNRDVTASLARFEEFTDTAKINSIMGEN